MAQHSTPNTQHLSYSEKLKDPRWQRKRLEIMLRDGFQCQFCFDETTTLHVHHKYYEKGRDPWEYADAALVTLCEVCHENEEVLTGGNGKLFMEDVRHSPVTLQHLRVWGEALRAMQPAYQPGLIAYAYAFALRDAEMQKWIVEKFMEKMK